MSNWIQTYTGKKFNLSNPDPSDVCIEDIAHSLSLLCRFNGHVSEFYSVAQHSVLASNMVPDCWKLEALLHDAHEAYIGDITTPFKRECLEIKTHENRIACAVRAAFSLLPVIPHTVKIADLELLRVEAELLFADTPKWVEGLPPSYGTPAWKPLGPLEAEKLFMDRFKNLHEGDHCDLAGADWM